MQDDTKNKRKSRSSSRGGHSPRRSPVSKDSSVGGRDMTETEQWKCVGSLPEGMPKVQYKGCGLDGVYIVGGYETVKTNYGDGIAVDDIDGLHRAIGEFLVTQKKELSGKELRFLRKEMDLTQSELGKFIGISSQQVARWEKSHSA